ncbi:MAG: bifunctional GNAT family N-acetyltransferase/carbon-nitrogen hydrolase family protein [Crocinitomicaceae bacterium]|nr:bifunctional GNAT family N-acetyltransferase/carbon-nitrogen hydrolase family protein [Crocinitomicaceae bacterium]
MSEPIENIELELLKPEDVSEVQAIMKEVYANVLDPSWTSQQLLKLIEVFPDGQIVVRVNGEIAGCALAIVVEYNKYGDQHSYQKITGAYTFDTHNDDGETLYGIDVFVKKDYRGLKIGRRLYEYRKQLAESLNLKQIIFGGRIPNYHAYANELTPKQYIEKVKSKEIDDPVLVFHLSNDFVPFKILQGYLEGDKDSKEYAVLLKWFNIYYEAPIIDGSFTKKDIRLGLVQWQMRSYPDLPSLMQQIKFFVDALSDYKADFALFPEFFNAPLMAQYNHLGEAEAIRKLAEYTADIVNEFQKLSVSYNINIITGSMPELVDGKLYNVGYLCHRDGRVDRFEKLHVTPDEKRCWGIVGGNEVNVFDTDCGKVGVLICYDVEFPELPRILADEGMNILFVPFLTDTQNGYSRVRYCAQARAIENECYVAIAGSVGNLPNVANMGIQYAQSMVFTPCDFAFPTDGIKSEATPNTEMILIADVDIDLINELNSYGSVTNLKDRRKDLYSLRKKLIKP